MYRVGLAPGTFGNFLQRERLYEQSLLTNNRTRDSLGFIPVVISGSGIVSLVIISSVYIQIKTVYLNIGDL